MDDIKGAIEIGKLVREKPKEHLDKLVTKILSEKEEIAQQGNCASSN